MADEMNFFAELEELIDRAIEAGVDRSEIAGELSLKAEAMIAEDDG